MVMHPQTPSPKPLHSAGREEDAVYDPTFIAKFEARVDKRGADECWLWTGVKNTKGYGRLEIATRRRPAAQVAWEIENGKPFPTPLFACHKCDNPPCCNPDHIWPGSNRENLIDASRKGRLSRVPEDAKCLVCGHPRSNDYVRPTGARTCRRCSKHRSMRNKIAKRVREAAAKQMKGSNRAEV